MKKDPLLPIGYELIEGTRIRSLLFSGDDWQIYDTQESVFILLAKQRLALKWLEFGFINEPLLQKFTFRSSNFWSISSDKKYMLTPVEERVSNITKIDAMAFSYALKESRKLSDNASFHDAIYVEQYSRLLPTWTLTPYVEDEVILGTWITGGIVISTKSFRRLSSLMGWMPASDLAEIIQAAGFSVPTHNGFLTEDKPKSQTQFEKNAIIIPASKKKQQQTPNTKVENRVFTLPGRPKIEKFFNDQIIDIIYNSNKYKKLGIEFPSAIVLYGPPGCGKTFAVEKLIEFIDWPSFAIDSACVGSPYIHETSKKISEVFNRAIDNSPSVLVIDEMESFLSDRQSGGTSSLHHVEEVAEFLRRIPEAVKKKVLIIAMTNRISMIDPAIIRRGRFDHVIEVEMPSIVEVESLIKSLLRNLPKSNKLDLTAILDALTGRALSDSAFVVREAARLAAKAGKKEIDHESIDDAIKSLPDEEKINNSRAGFV